jgi:hypothetical protein
MIPVKQGLYSEIDLNFSPDDSENMKKYKVLLNIGYGFCIKIIDSVIQKTSKHTFPLRWRKCRKIKLRHC